ncbi:protein ABHD11 isoform X2 [Hemicordylus capensis]|uniref:protein ABHD11 isoform X2 n=1 Tax=Hemicordylus capensis TaxID=884348 RepID=UPI002303CB3F|nr:protein ABHD11 isoform X2 [Hemicordylus capensis]
MAEARVSPAPSPSRPAGRESVWPRPLRSFGPVVSLVTHQAGLGMLRALGCPRAPPRWAQPPPLRRWRAGLARERKGLASHAVTPVPLSYAVLDGPSPQPPLVFLHGLFGSKSNFQSLAKKLVAQTGRKVLTVDARNHGNSPYSSLMTYEAMSADVRLLLCQLHLQRCVLVGHSMGGKTAMVLALQELELVDRLVCVDMSPSETTAVTSFQSFLTAMKAVDIPRGIPCSTTRRLAEEQLRPAIQEPAIRQFLLTNLVYTEDQFMWRVNLEAVSQHLKELMGFPDFQTSYTGPALFLGGSRSGYISRPIANSPPLHGTVSLRLCDLPAESVGGHVGEISQLILGTA